MINTGASNRNASRNGWLKSLIVKLYDWVSANLLQPLLGMSLAHRFVSVFFGFWFGIFPIPGLSTPVLLSAVYCANRIISPELSISEMAVATAVNLIATPVCFALLPFWIKLGCDIFSIDSPCDTASLLTEFKKSGAIDTVSSYSICLAVGSAAWLMLSPFAMALSLFIRQKIIGNQSLIDDVRPSPLYRLRA